MAPLLRIVRKFLLNPQWPVRIAISNRIFFLLSIEEVLSSHLHRRFNEKLPLPTAHTVVPNLIINFKAMDLIVDFIVEPYISTNKAEILLELV